MMRKIIVVLAALLITAGWALAEPGRLLLSTENKMPDLHQLEAGLLFNYAEIPAVFPDYGDNEEYYAAPYLRFGLLENLTVVGRVPFVSVDPEFGDGESGLGDVSLGFQLLAFEDALRYPYVIPYADVSFPTGDEDKGLGTGETMVKLGAAVGTTVQDVFHYVADISYTVAGGDYENYAGLSLGFIWDLSKKFSLLLEGNVRDLDYEGDSYTLFGQAGMTYRATKALMFGVYGGAGDVEDTSISFKTSYTFF